MSSKEKWKPRPEQIRGVRLIIGGKGTRLFLPPGMGKTAVVLKAFTIVKAAGHADALLVLGPLRVITTSWIDQVHRWEDFEGLRISVIHGDREEAMSVDADVYLMNYEGLISPIWRSIQKIGKRNQYVKAPVAKEFLSRKRFMLAVDESTKMKSRESSRFQVLEKYLPMMKYRTIMTGTPKPNHLEDLFSQCFLTDLGRDLGSFITHFRRRYMTRDIDGGPYSYTPLPGAMERIASTIHETTLSIADVDPVPSRVIQMWAPLPDEVRERYNELKSEFVTEFEGTTVMAPNTAVLWGKLRQVAQGAIYTGEGRNYKELHTAKIDILRSIVEELDGEPVVCFFQYGHDRERICKEFGYEVPSISGGTSVPKGMEWCREFGCGLHPILLAHPASASLGIDGLQVRCHNIIWFGLSWSFEETYQAKKRIVREGNKAEEVFIYQILIDCAIERVMLEAVKGKELSNDELCRLIREQITVVPE